MQSSLFVDPIPLQRFIGTFHKSGTVLFHKILRAARDAGLLNFWLMNATIEPSEWDVGFCWHAGKLFPQLEGASFQNVRAVICIRDPRDVVVSGAYYHQVSDEKWLQHKRPMFGGLTYQEKINSLPDMQARFQFEMGATGKRTIDAMRSIPKNTDAIHVTRLETLVGSARDDEYRTIFKFLGFEGERLEALLKIAERNSITPKTTEPGTSSVAGEHVRSGRPQQYLSEFSAETLAMFNELHGDIAAQLGYPD